MTCDTIRRAIAPAVGIAVLCHAAAFGATLTGTIVYEGPPLEQKSLDMEADPVCHAKHSVPPKSEKIVVGEGQALANVLVRVTGGLPDKEYPVPEKPVVLDQVNCVYVPHVIAIRAGQPLEILNDDGTLHNVHALSRVNRQFNFAMPKFRKKATKVFTKEERAFRIKCDVHPWMLAWCAVMSHPFFAVTGLQGTYEIEGLDAGTYEVESWHERLGTQTATITVGADEAKTADFTFTAPEE